MDNTLSASRATCTTLQSSGYCTATKAGATRPKRGSAVLWPHGLDTNPREKDVRTHHEAMPVVQGTKWGANYWIHGRDFKLAMASGCDGRQGQPKRSRLLKDGLAEKRVKEDESMRNGAPAGARGG